MNKHEKEIAKAQLSSEEKTLKELQQVFKKARQDVQEKISELNSRTDMQNLQSIIYQKKYQQAILDQINEAFADLKSGQYKTVEEYLVESYDNGYIGMMYSLQSQGIPMIMPINDRDVVRALTTDSKLSSKYYQSNPLKGRLAENVDLLKQRVRSNLSRGIIAGKSWLDVAVDIASGMNNPFDIALKDAMRIVRTEGHRVHQQGFLDAGDKAKDKGADILKQWDATMDRKTRPAHQQADGQIVEWDDYFTVGGEKMKAPSVGGSAKNVCNCRCQLLQRARWALDESELETLQKRSEFFGLDKSESFEDYKQKYLKLPEKADTMELKGSISSLDDCETIEDVEKLFKEKNWYWETTINGQHIRSIDGMSLKGLDLESAKLTYQSQEKLFEKFPQLIGKLNGITAGQLAPQTYANCMFGLGHGGVTLNTKYFGDYAKLVRTFERDLKSGFHPAGVGAGSIVTHEFGHALDDLLTNVYHVAGFNNWKPKSASAYLRPKVMKACGLKVSDIGSSVSGYATKDALEWFAECFCEYVESENPRPVAQEFGRQLEELMKGVDWNANA